MVKQMKQKQTMTKAERKKKIIYGLLAVACIFLGLYLEHKEQQAHANNETVVQESISTEAVAEDYVDYYFRNDDLLEQHYKKHGMEMGFDSMEAYEDAASAVVNNPEALSKTEAEDGDYVYYIEETNEFVIVSQDGYIRTYFNPSDGLDYYNRQ